MGRYSLACLRTKNRLFDNSRDRWSAKALLARVGRRSVQRTVPTLRQQRCVLPGSLNASQGQHTRKQSFRTPNHGNYQRASFFSSRLCQAYHQCQSLPPLRRVCPDSTELSCRLRPYARHGGERCLKTYKSLTARQA